MPSPRGMVMERAFFTPAFERTQTLCPIDMPGPKFVYDRPFGARLCISVRTTESDPGSHPAAMTLTVPVSLLTLSRDLR